MLVSVLGWSLCCQGLRVYVEGRMALTRLGSRATPDSWMVVTEGRQRRVGKASTACSSSTLLRRCSWESGTKVSTSGQSRLWKGCGRGQRRVERAVRVERAMLGWKECGVEARSRWPSCSTQEVTSAGGGPPTLPGLGRGGRASSGTRWS